MCFNNFSNDNLFYRSRSKKSSSLTVPIPESETSKEFSEASILATDEAAVISLLANQLSSHINHGQQQHQQQQFSRISNNISSHGYTLLLLLLKNALESVKEFCDCLTPWTMWFGLFTVVTKFLAPLPPTVLLVDCHLCKHKITIHIMYWITCIAKAIPLFCHLEIRLLSDNKVFSVSNFFFIRFDPSRQSVTGGVTLPEDVTLTPVDDPGEGDQISQHVFDHFDRTSLTQTSNGTPNPIEGVLKTFAILARISS